MYSAEYSSDKFMVFGVIMTYLVLFFATYALYQYIEMSTRLARFAMAEAELARLPLSARWLNSQGVRFDSQCCTESCRTLTGVHTTRYVRPLSLAGHPCSNLRMALDGSDTEVVLYPLTTRRCGEASCQRRTHAHLSAQATPGLHSGYVWQ